MRTLDHLSSKAACRIVGGVYGLTGQEFPPLVRVETTNACNAKCVMCPHGQISRPIQRIDDDLYTRIVDECAARGCKEIQLHNFGEPLLDKRLEARVRYAKQQGLAKVKIFSNGSLLDETRARGLIEAGLDEFKVSFDGATREEFESIRTPLKFDRVVENVRRLVAIRDEMRSPLQVHVGCCSTTDKQSTMRSLEKLVDGFSFGKIHNWAGEGSQTSGTTGGSRSKIRKPCSRLWKNLTVLASGDVALCCLDYDGQHLLGRVDQDTSIHDVWQSAAYREVRALHREARQAEIDLCRNCTKSFL